MPLSTLSRTRHILVIEIRSWSDSSNVKIQQDKRTDKTCTLPYSVTSLMNKDF